MPKARAGCFLEVDGADTGAGPGWDAARVGCGRWGVDFVAGFEGEVVPVVWAPDLGHLDMSVEEEARRCRRGIADWMIPAGMVAVGSVGGEIDLQGDLNSRKASDSPGRRD